MVHPQRVHHFPDDYEFRPKKDVYLRRHYGERTVDLIPLKRGRAALKRGRHTWAYPSINDALAALTRWDGAGDPPGNSGPTSESIAS